MTQHLGVLKIRDAAAPMTLIDRIIYNRVAQSFVVQFLFLLVSLFEFLLSVFPYKALSLTRITELTEIVEGATVIGADPAFTLPLIVVMELTRSAGPLMFPVMSVTVFPVMSRTGSIVLVIVKIILLALES